MKQLYYCQLHQASWISGGSCVYCSVQPQMNNFTTFEHKYQSPELVALNSIVSLLQKVLADLDLIQANTAAVIPPGKKV